jgi:hypothetical protein
MQKLNKRRVLFAACASAVLAISSPVFAQHAGGHGGGYGHAGGYGHGGYGHGGYGHGGYWHGGYWHGGYWHGGYWYGGYWGPWGWGWGFPFYYPAFWWGGIPYFYANDVYYTWDDASGQYQTVVPPPEALSQAQGQGAAAPADLTIYPKNGQSEQQLGKDRFECHRWAVAQTGFDPTQPGGGAAPGNRAAYNRAQGACLEGRGYSVR